MAELTNKNRTQSASLNYPEEDDADYISILESKTHQQTALTKTSRSFTPPMPRALSNTLAKIGKKSPTLKKKGFISRQFFPPDSEHAGKMSSLKDNSLLSSTQSFSKLGVVVTSGRHAHRRSVSVILWSKV